MNIFEQLGMRRHPLFLAPLAGVSDHPFRRVCAAQGADLCYVEMISATALNYDNPRTLAMITRHPDEARLGIQITGATAESTAQAIAKLDRMNFDTIDINMGCPVRKVVKTGCGSAILRDPERVYQTVKLACQATSKPLSVKIRIGWDRQSINGVEVAQAAYEGGCSWITVHGRSRACDYSQAVDLESIRLIKQAVAIPVLGNGNLFTAHDTQLMQHHTGVDGFMISRGALGNPWVFRQIHDHPGSQDTTLEEWFHLVKSHLVYQNEAYGDLPVAAVCMRKHLLWYTKGWIQGKIVRERINGSSSLPEGLEILRDFYQHLQGRQAIRLPVTNDASGHRFQWDPKFDMNRILDRGVGTDGMD